MDKPAHWQSGDPYSTESVCAYACLCVYTFFSRFLNSSGSTIRFLQRCINLTQGRTVFLRQSPPFTLLFLLFPLSSHHYSPSIHSSQLPPFSPLSAYPAPPILPFVSLLYSPEIVSSPILSPLFLLCPQWMNGSGRKDGWIGRVMDEWLAGWVEG